MTKQPLTPQPDSSLAIISMVFGIISLTGPGLLLGIPAIIIGIIALKKRAGSRSLSITGLVTGAISTVLSILFFICIALIIGWGISHPEYFEQTYPLPEQIEPYSNSQI